MLGWELPPHNSGGLGVASYNICRSLSKSNIDIEFIVPYDSPHNIDFMKVTPATPIDVTSITRSSIAYDSYKYINSDGSEQLLNIYDQQSIYELSVIKLVEDKDFDILHAHDWLTFRAAIRIKELKKIPIILHVHSVESDRAGSKNGNPLVQEIEYLALSMADHIVAVSNRTKDKIIEDYNIPADKIEVIHNSINFDDIEPISNQTAHTYLACLKQNGYKIITSIGRITIQKGLPNLLHALQEVIRRNPKTILLIQGSGEQYNELLGLSADLGIGANVLFTEFQRGKNLRDSLAIGNLFVMPSISEPFGLTALEAIGYGTPVLISKQSGVSEIINHCLKINFWDIKEMINQIHGLINNPALEVELLNNSKQELVNLSWDSSADKIKNLYHKKLLEVST